MKFYDLMRAANLKRWHLINTVRQQTLAEHLWLVTVISLELYQHMHGMVLADNQEVKKLVGLALFHDAPEVVMGDPPGNAAKRLFRKYGGPYLFTAIEQEVMPDIPYFGNTDNAALKHIVTMADRIEAYWWITENGVGVHAGLAAKHCARNLVEYVRQRVTEDGDGPGWPDAVNKVLVALGMPYIYFDAMVSPP